MQLIQPINQLNENENYGACIYTIEMWIKLACNSEKNGRIPLFEEWVQVPHKQMLYRAEQELLQLVLSGMPPPHWIFTQGSELLHILFAVLDDKRDTHIQQRISEGNVVF
jgi:hypothetical protein